MKTYLILLFLLTGLSCKAADTNLVYVTDDGFVVGVSHAGTFRLNPQKVESSKTNKECLPAYMFTEGNWGKPQGGFQLSLRFAKNSFSSNSTIQAIMLLRNVTNQVLTYSAVDVQGQASPIGFVVSDATGKAIIPKSDEITIISRRDLKLYPGTQRRFTEQLDNIYNLPSGCPINVKADLMVDCPACFDIQSAEVVIEINPQ
jgi:hypothetical protein